MADDLLKAVAQLIGAVGGLIYTVALLIFWIRTPDHGWLETLFWAGMAALLTSWMLHGLRLYFKHAD